MKILRPSLIFKTPTCFSYLTPTVRSRSYKLFYRDVATMRRITKEFRKRASGAHPLTRSVNSSRFRRWRGLHLRLAVEEDPDRRERTGMGHVEPGASRSLVGRSVLQRTVQLPNMMRLGRSGEHALVHEGLEGVLLLVVLVVVRRLPRSGKSS